MGAVEWIGIGILAGSILTNILFYMKSAYGVLRIDHSNPEKDVYRLDINTDDLEIIKKKKRIIFKIDHKADLSQE